MDIPKRNCLVPEEEISFDFIRSAGPGGQNVNKVSSAVQLRWNLMDSKSINADIKTRIIKLAGTRISNDGTLILIARRFRTQDANKLDALARLQSLIEKASIEPKIRKKTKPTVTSKAARVSTKRQHGEQKKIRAYNPDEWE